MTWLLETVLGDYRTNARILFLLSKLSGLINGLIIRNDDAWMSCLIARNNSQLVLINFKLNDYAIKRSLIKILAWYIANLIITLTLLMSKASNKFQTDRRVSHRNSENQRQISNNFSNNHESKRESTKCNLATGLDRYLVSASSYIELLIVINKEPREINRDL